MLNIDPVLVTDDRNIKKSLIILYVNLRILPISSKNICKILNKISTFSIKRKQIKSIYFLFFKSIIFLSFILFCMSMGHLDKNIKINIL